MNPDIIRELTQSLLALTVVIGGGMILYAQPSSPAITFVAGTIGAVIGYYFSRVSNAAGANTVLRSLGK
jgi:hypothetical protein